MNKATDDYNTGRAAPTLGMRRGATFVVKPLHDPSGEFAIVLYDPTIDDVAEEPATKSLEAAVEETQKIDEPIVHKSLADILGLKKDVEERPKVPVVIDPRLSKILRPHQVEGVKVLLQDEFCGRNEADTEHFDSSFTDVLLGWLTRTRMDVSWQMVWDWAKRCVQSAWYIFLF